MFANIKSTPKFCKTFICTNELAEDNIIDNIDGEFVVWLGFFQPISYLTT